MNRSEVLTYVIADLRDRADIGFKKYGCTIDDSPDDMLQHLYEEILDAAMYIKTRIRQEKKREKEVNRQLPLDLGDYT